MGAKYDVVGVDVLWGADYSTNYILQIRSEAPSDADKADDEAWTTVATVTDAAKNSAKYSAFMEEARYIRLHSLAKSAAQCIRLREVSVFGTEWKPKDDTEKPVMVSATVFSKTWNSVVISVEATDNYGVKKYHVVDAKHAIDTLILPIDEKISIPDLLPSTEYTFTITAVDIVALESDNSKNVTFKTEEHLTAPKVAVADPTWPEGQVKAFYSDTYTPFCEWNYNAGWGQSTQLKEEEIGGNHMLHYTNMNWLGWVLLSGNPYNVLTMEKFHIDLWAEEDGKLKLTPIFGGEGKTTDDGKGVFVDVIGQQWNSYDIALTDFNGLDLTSIFQFKISDGTLTEFFVDNAYFYRTTELKDELKPTNLQASIAEQGYFSVTLNLSAEDNFGVVNFVVKDGEKEVAAGGGVSGKEVKVVVANLKPNTDYTFAVIAKDESNNETDPVEVTAKTLAAPAAAPKPNFGEKKVAAVFCDAIEGGPAITIGNWSQTTIAASIELAEGDHVFYLQKTNYLGWELAPAVKAGDLEFLHVDFYSKDMTSISLTPISPGKEGSYTVQLKANEWVSTDIPLSAFAAAGIAWDNIFQFKFMNATPEGKELFIDNVYFHTKKAEGIEGIQNTEYSVQKVLRNGQVIILRGDKMYTLTGQAIQ